jgi:hypothetical protein
MRIPWISCVLCGLRVVWVWLEWGMMLGNLTKALHILRIAEVRFTLLKLPETRLSFSK